MGEFEMERKKITCIFLSCFLATVIFQVVSVQKTYAANEPVSVWLTKADKSKLLLPQSSVNFSSDSGTNDRTINVNDNINYQKMDGFGASLTDSSAYLIQNKLSTAARDTLMTNLFDKTNGIGISLLRQTIGSCDYSRNQYSYDEMESGQTDDNLNNFSINHDNEYIVPLLQQALQKNSSMKIMATPWSPPGWMKTSGSMIGGTLNTSAYNAYANYFVKYINAYKELGLPIYAVTVQNEPEYAPPNYPGMAMSASEEANFIKNNLGPAFIGNSISTKIIAYDHNFNDINYPLSVLGDSGANPYIAGTAWHLYAGGQESMTAVHNAYPTKDNWFTEGSDGSWAGDGSWHDSFKQHMAKAIRVTRNWSKSVLWWNMALDENNGPTVLDKSTCYGVLTVNQSTGAVSYNADYYTLGQFSKFVDSGAYRIESNSFDNDVEDVAFKNPDGSKVLVVDNTNTVDKSVKVKWGSESVTYTIPADSAITFKWAGSQSGSQTIVKPAWYQNFETGSGFTVGTNGVATIDSSSANNGGTKSVKLTNSGSGDPGCSAQCVNVAPSNGKLLDTSPYGYLNFYVKDMQGVNTVKLTFVDKNNAEYSTWTTTRSAKDQWIPINFSLCSITGIDTTAIKEIRVGEYNPGVYYFDDFYLSGDSTLVTPAFEINKTTLRKAISDATTLMESKTVGTEVGSVPQTAKNDFQSAITVAGVVKDNEVASQLEVDAQVIAIATATTNFNNAVFLVNRAALTTAISDANTLMESKTVGTEVGNVPQTARDTLQSAITAATAVNTNAAATQAEADSQVVALATSTTNFNSAVIVAPDKGFQKRINKIKAKLNGLVKAGYITKTQEDAILKFVTTKLNKGAIKTGLDALVKAGIITQAQETIIVKF